MGLVLKDIWLPEDITSMAVRSHLRRVANKSELIELGKSFSIAMSHGGLITWGINGQPNSGKSTFVSGVTGKAHVKEHLTIDTIFVEGVGTVVHADLGNPGVYKHPIDLVDLRRKNHAERHGSQSLDGADLIEHVGNCRWSREFEGVTFITRHSPDSESRDVFFVASPEFEQTPGFQEFLGRSSAFTPQAFL